MIYLDHAATTPVLEEVAHAVYDTLVSGWGNPSSQYPIGKQARNAVAAARETIAAALGCKSEQFVFTSCGSESDNWAVRLALHQNRHVGKRARLSRRAWPSSRRAAPSRSYRPTRTATSPPLRSKVHCVTTPRSSR